MKVFYSGLILLSVAYFSFLGGATFQQNRIYERAMEHRVGRYVTHPRTGYTEFKFIRGDKHIYEIDNKKDTK